MEKLGTVLEIAWWIIKENKVYQPDAARLISLIPDNTLKTEITNRNFQEIVANLDKIRFKKGQKLLGILGLKPKDSSGAKKEDVLYKILNLSLSERLDLRRKELKFLFNLAATICHL